MFRVDISSLPDGTHAQVHHPSASDLELDSDVYSDIEVPLHLDVNGRRILAAFEATGTARLECDRTLKPYDQPLSGRHAVLFVPPTEEVREGEEEVRRLPDDATAIDLTDAVRDTLLLAIPMRRVAPEAEDVEIETSFGASSEDGLADDRWAVLKKLRDDG